MVPQPTTEPGLASPVAGGRSAVTASAAPAVALRHTFPCAESNIRYLAVVIDIRPARKADVDQVAAVHVRSWQVGYRDLLALDYLAQLRPEDRAKRYTFESPDPAQPVTLVAVDGGTIVGFATTGPSKDIDAPGAGELLALYVDPPHWGCGIGGALIAVARNKLCEQGFLDALLWVLVGNDRAERFYRADGWNEDGSQRREKVWGTAVDEIRFRRSLA